MGKHDYYDEKRQKGGFANVKSLAIRQAVKTGMLVACPFKCGYHASSPEFVSVHIENWHQAELRALKEFGFIVKEAV